MDLINMTYKVQSINFIRRVNRENCYLSSHSFEFGDLLRGMEAENK